MDNNQSLVQALNNCAAECNHCATACLDEVHVQMLAACIRLDGLCCHLHHYCHTHRPQFTTWQTSVTGMYRSVHGLCR